MTVEEYEGLFYFYTNTNETKFAPALLLAELNNAEQDFADRTLCLLGSPVSRISMVGQQSYDTEGDRNYLDAASDLSWYASGSGTNEYYCALTAGGADPSLDEPDNLHMDGTLLTEGTLGSLADHEWGYGDNDTLLFDTVYIADATDDPDDSEVSIYMEPGGFGFSNIAKILRFRYDALDITQNELDIGEIGYEESIQSEQTWSQWESMLYLDPIPTSAKTMQIWPALLPTEMTLSTSTPTIKAAYHRALLDYALWKFYEGTQALAKAKDYQAQYQAFVTHAFAQAKSRRTTAVRGPRRVFP